MDRLKLANDVLKSTLIDRQRVPDVYIIPKLQSDVYESKLSYCQPFLLPYVCWPM